MTNLLYQFKNWLESKKLTKVSIKNYVSDARRFFKWTAKNNFTHLSAIVFSTYKSHLISQKTPTKSINRYLSSLRRLGKFLKEEKITMFNPTQSLENISLIPGIAQFRGLIKSPELNSPELTSRFKEALFQEKLKPATIKNYVSDANQFLKWLEKKEI